ncbi:MAG TPA: ABC transporter permease [Bauldia sp.]|nr:ABC transporter permease [Bauldia sp.]
MFEIRERLREYGPIVALVLLVVLVGAYDPRFFAPDTLLGLVSDTMTLFIMASGLTFVIIMGGIDLSIQSVASLASVILALFLPELGFAAIPLTLLAGAVAGFAGGISHTALRIPSFISTLAVGGIATSAAFVISNARSIDITTPVRDGVLFWVTGRPLGIPNEILVGIVVLVGLSLILRYTPFGRFVVAIGASERAVHASGINVNLVKIGAFCLSGLMAGLSGIVFAARLSSGSPTLANEFLLPAVAAVIVGGTALTGGVGSIWRTFVGALIIAVVRIGMTFMGVSIFAQQIVFGLVLVVAVAATMDRLRIHVIK